MSTEITGRDANQKPREIRTDDVGQLIVTLSDSANPITLDDSARDLLSTIANAAPAPLRLHADFGAVTHANAETGGQCFVLAMAVTNANAARRWFQLHDTGGAPMATDVPKYSFAVAPSAPLVIGHEFFTGKGSSFVTGIGWAWSTTPGAFTDAATAADHTTHIHTSL
jgi:hypothetical protein